MKFCSKIDVNLDSDIPQKPKIAHWKALVSEFCQINQKCEKLNQKATAGKSICIYFFFNTL